MVAKVEEFIPSVNEKPRVKITSDKWKSTFTVLPAPGGFVHYQVQVDVGSVPKALQGLYTQIDKAVEAVLKYERTHPGSKAVDRDNKAAARKKRKEADAQTVQRDSSEHVRQGADHREG